MSDCCKDEPEHWVGDIPTQPIRLADPEPLRRVMLLPEEVEHLFPLSDGELAEATGMLIIRGPKELLDQIRVL